MTGLRETKTTTKCNFGTSLQTLGPPSLPHSEGAGGRNFSHLVSINFSLLKKKKHYKEHSFTSYIYFYFLLFFCGFGGGRIFKP